MARMRSWTERLTTTKQRKDLREQAFRENKIKYGDITCERCKGKRGEASASGRTIVKFEMDHRRNISSAGVDRQLRYALEIDPSNHWILCEPCHYEKTLEEARIGRAKKASPSKRKHPGVTW